MEIAVKVGHKFALNDNSHLYGLRDGNILEMRPDGFFKGALERKHHCILTTQHDYWELRGTHDHKSYNQKVLDLKKFRTSRFSNGKYMWDYSDFEEIPEELEQEKKRPVDYFIDFKFLLDKKIITKSQFDAIYDKSRDPGRIYIDRALESYIFDEDVHVRRKSEYSNRKGSITSGTYYVASSGGDYTTWKLAVDDIADLTGDISILGKDAEEMAESNIITYDINTGSYKTIFGVKSGSEHNGGAYGNGHRISWGTSNYFYFNSNNVNNVIVQDLAYNTANNSFGIRLYVGFNTTPCIIQRCLAKGVDSGDYVIHCVYASKKIIVRNNIGYNTHNGIYLDNSNVFTQWEFYNNTLIDEGAYGLNITNDPGQPGTIICKNNLLLNNATADINNPGVIDTHSKNVTSDATSPDTSYRSKDMITNSVFKDYANDDFRLKKDGDTTNLAILDDGDYLSGIGSPAQFSDDIQRQTRNKWYIGASEIAGVGNAIFFAANF